MSKKMKREEIIVLLILLLFVQGYLLRNVFPAILAFSLIFYLLYLRAEFSPLIKVDWSVDTKLVEGIKASSRLKIKNLTNKKIKVKIFSSLLLPGFKVEEIPVFTLREKEEKEVEFSITPVKGVYRLKGPEVRIMDLRELYHADFSVDSEIEVEVYPSLDKIREDARVEESIRIATTYQKALMGLQTIELHSLRKFQPGDDTKHVEWKATARLGELIVKDFLREVEGDIYIILDAGREMRKGMRNSKIDYAITLTLQLAYALGRYRLGLIVYDDYGIKHRVEASRSPEQIERIVRSLKISPVYSDILGVKMPEISFKVSEKARNFLRKVMPAIKGRRSFATGLIESVGTLPSSAFLIFISDITAHTGELIRVLSELRNRHKILLLTPNPVLFYDESKIDRETLLWLYERYLEREEVIRKLNRIVPTLDLGPSDLLEAIRGVVR
jgi:uncharacterized protein (DUF58 family)